MNNNTSVALWVLISVFSRQFRNRQILDLMGPKQKLGCGFVSYLPLPPSPSLTNVQPHYRNLILYLQIIFLSFFFSLIPLLRVALSPTLSPSYSSSSYQALTPTTSVIIASVLYAISDLSSIPFLLSGHPIDSPLAHVLIWSGLTTFPVLLLVCGSTGYGNYCIGSAGMRNECVLGGIWTFIGLGMVLHGVTGFTTSVWENLPPPLATLTMVQKENITCVHDEDDDGTGGDSARDCDGTLTVGAEIGSNSSSSNSGGGKAAIRNVILVAFIMSVADFIGKLSVMDRVFDPNRFDNDVLKLEADKARRNEQIYRVDKQINKLKIENSSQENKITKKTSNRIQISERGGILASVRLEPFYACGGLITHVSCDRIVVFDNCSTSTTSITSDNSRENECPVVLETDQGEREKATVKGWGTIAADAVCRKILSTGDGKFDGDTRIHDKLEEDSDNNNNDNDSIIGSKSRKRFLQAVPMQSPLHQISIRAADVTDSEMPDPVIEEGRVGLCFSSGTYLGALVLLPDESTTDNNVIVGPDAVPSWNASAVKHLDEDDAYEVLYILKRGIIGKSEYSIKKIAPKIISRKNVIFPNFYQPRTPNNYKEDLPGGVSDLVWIYAATRMIDPFSTVMYKSKFSSTERVLTLMAARDQIDTTNGRANLPSITLSNDPCLAQNLSQSWNRTLLPIGKKGWKKNMKIGLMIPTFASMREKDHDHGKVDSLVLLSKLMKMLIDSFMSLQDSGVVASGSSLTYMLMGKGDESLLRSFLEERENGALRQEEKIVSFKYFEQWMPFIHDNIDFVVSFDLYAGMLSISSGVPTMFIPLDYDSFEIMKSMGMPTVPLEVVNSMIGEDGKGSSKAYDFAYLINTVSGSDFKMFDSVRKQQINKYDRKLESAKLRINPILRNVAHDNCS